MQQWQLTWEHEKVEETKGGGQLLYVGVHCRFSSGGERRTTGNTHSKHNIIHVATVVSAHPCSLLSRLTYIAHCILLR